MSGETRAARKRSPGRSATGRRRQPLRQRIQPFRPIGAGSEVTVRGTARRPGGFPRDARSNAEPWQRVHGELLLSWRSSLPMTTRSPLAVSSTWIQVAILTFVVGFGILGYLAYRVYAEHPPVPRATVAPDGTVVFTRDDIFDGQVVFEKYGLMEYGTIFGHGAYLGPDFTADYIERARAVHAPLLRGARHRRPRRAHRRRLQGEPLRRGPRRPRVHDGPGRRLARARRLLPALVRARRESNRTATPERGPRAYARSRGVLRLVGVGRDREPTGQGVLVHEQLAARAGRREQPDRGRRAVVSALPRRAARRDRGDLVRVRTLPGPRVAGRSSGGGPRARVSQARRGAAHPRAALHGLVLPGRGRPVSAPGSLRRRQRPLPRRAERLSSGSTSRRGSRTT